MMAVRADEPRLDLLRSLGAGAPELEELQRYNQNHFNLDALEDALALPLPDEPFVEAWEAYAAAAARLGVFEVLRDRLVQLRFPVRAGISATVEYAAATRRGTPPPVGEDALTLRAPERLRLWLHPTAAGRIPVLVCGERTDFLALVRALARRNEPAGIADSLGALMLSGYNNWDRVARLRRRFEQGELAIPGVATWSAAFARIRERKELYQDRLLLLSTGPYSGVAASELGLPEQQWQQLSLAIRLEHECAHYITRRLLGSMRNNLLDELIADYAGIVAAARELRAGWLPRFLGVEHPYRLRPGGRLENYRGDPPLSEGAFHILQHLARRACWNLEAADRTLGDDDRSPAGRSRMILALAGLTLEDLAADDGNERIRARYDATRVVWTGPVDVRPVPLAAPPPGGT